VVKSTASSRFFHAQVSWQHGKGLLDQIQN
jgi:hypothetical protein